MTMNEVCEISNQELLPKRRHVKCAEDFTVVILTFVVDIDLRFW